MKLGRETGWGPGVRWLDQAQADAIDELIAAVKASEDRPAGEGQVHLAPRLHRALNSLECVQYGDRVKVRCDGSFQRVWRDHGRWYCCDTCDQRFGDHELRCNEGAEGWHLPEHDRYVKPEQEASDGR